MTNAPATHERPMRVRDELAWELVRDEWELLLAIGSGPTSIDVAAKALASSTAQVARRVALLESHGLVRASASGFSLVPAFYERREGMSSYVRDLVLRRLQEDSAAPVSGRACLEVGDGAELARLIARAEEKLFPAIVELANRPESEHSQRFSVFFASAEAPTASHDIAFRNQLLEVLRAAATRRSLDPEAKDAYLWVAEMRVDPDVAVEVGELFERFLDSEVGVRPADAAHANPHRPSRQVGAAVFAVLPASGRLRSVS